MADGSMDAVSPVNELGQATGSILSRKIWLPKILYDALPFFYFFAGITAFLATVYVHAWFWVLPHYVLFSVACVHLSIAIFRRRNRGRRSEHVNPTTD